MSQPAPFAPAPFTPAPAPPRRSSAGRIVGIVVAAVVVLGGIAAGALFLVGKPVLDEAKVQAEIVRITRDATGVEPTGVSCPKDVPLHAGDVSRCTAQIDGQAVTYSVSQDDDQGNVQIRTDFVVVRTLEKILAERFQQTSGTTFTATCADGKKVVVGGKGTTIACTVTDAADPTDTTAVTGTVNDDQGNVSFS